MQIQRMCTNYYVADYEVRLAHRMRRIMVLTHRNFRILFHPRFCVLSHRVSLRTTEMTISYYQRQKKLVRTSYPYHER